MDSFAGIDDLDWKILEALHDNARLPYSDLGRIVGLTAPAVAQRMRRLEDAGVVVGYRVEVNLTRLGWPISAFIRLATKDSQCSLFAAAAPSFAEIVECHRITGEDGYVLQVVATSMAHLETVIDRLQRWGDTVTSLVLSSPVGYRPLDPLLDAARARRAGNSAKSAQVDDRLSV